MQPAAVFRCKPHCFETHRPGRHSRPPPGLAPSRSLRQRASPLDSFFCSHLPNRLKRHAPAPPFLFKTFPGRCRRSSPQLPDGFAFSPLAGQAITFGRAGESRLAIPLASSFHGSPRLATRREQPGAPVKGPSISFGKLTATSSPPCIVGHPPRHRRRCRPRRNPPSKRPLAGLDHVAAPAKFPAGDRIVYE